MRHSDTTLPNGEKLSGFQTVTRAIRWQGKKINARKAARKARADLLAMPEAERNRLAELYDE